METTQIAPAREVVMRCFAESEGEHWHAICLNYDLAVQGESFVDVRAKLEAMIDHYLEEVAGVDRQHASALLSRRAPLALWARYWGMVVATRLGWVKPTIHRPFDKHASAPSHVA
jgi:hypothetical protein